MKSRFILIALVSLAAVAWVAEPALGQGFNPNPPDHPVKLIFIHHSTGQGWLDDSLGGLGISLMDNNYFVSDTNYGWGPSYDADSTIGDHTDIGNWYDWFLGPSASTYTTALYAESGNNSGYTRMETDPGGANEIVMFKSCFPNSYISGNPNDAPLPEGQTNPIYSQGCCGDDYNVANVKGLYRDLLAYFAAHQDKLFILIVSPPLIASATDATHAANARAVANWLVTSWLSSYAYANIRAFDYFNVLTSNGGSRTTNDLGRTSGNHHRYWNSAIQHLQTVSSNYSAYGSGDSHPTAAGQKKATGEFIPLLNIWYNAWKGIAGPSLSVTAPASGVTWYNHAAENITWETSGSQNANVKIQLFKGATKVLDISTSTSNDGDFAWSIPGSLPAAANDKIRITTVDGFIRGESGIFSVAKPTLAISAPAKGEVWLKGTAQTITWTTNGPQNSTVKIQLLRSGVKVVDIDLAAPNSGSYDWTVPSSLPKSTSYKVRVRTIDGWVQGTSAAFTIR
jgi:hypothetical protein